MATRPLELGRLFALETYKGLGLTIPQDLSGASKLSTFFGHDCTFKGAKLFVQKTRARIPLNWDGNISAGVKLLMRTSDVPLCEYLEKHKHARTGIDPLGRVDKDISYKLVCSGLLVDRLDDADDFLDLLLEQNVALDLKVISL